MLDINPYLFPPGGYYFEESDGMTLKSDSLAGLVVRVEDYRARVNLPPGEPYKEIVDQICTRSPRACREVGEVPQGPTGEQKALVARVVKNSVKLGAQLWRLKFVKSPEAYARASTCSDCPHKKEWARFCPPCEKNAFASLQSAIHPRELVSMVKGCACDLAGDDLSAVVWVDSPERLNDAPEKCWRGKEHEDA